MISSNTSPFAETIAQAVEPGIYLLRPDTVYEIRQEQERCEVLRNGMTIFGAGADPSVDTLLHVAAEMGGLTTMTWIDLRASIEMRVAV